MDNPIEVLIPVIMFLTFGFVTAMWLFVRHRERMSMIERGMQAEEIKSLYFQKMQVNPLASLKWGLLLLFVGAAIILGIWLREYYIDNDGIIPGLMTLSGGIGLIAFYMFSRKKDLQNMAK